MRADGRITSFTDAMERLRLLSEAGEVLATRLLARVGGIENGIKPVAGLTVQPPPATAGTPAYGRNRKSGQTLACLLAHFEQHPHPQTVDQLAAATRLNTGTLHRVLTTSGDFERDRHRYRRRQPTKEVSRASA